MRERHALTKEPNVSDTQTHIRPTVTIALLLCGLVGIGQPAGATGPRDRQQPGVYVEDAASLEWDAVVAPEGAKRAIEYLGAQALVRWPPNAYLSMHARSIGWHGIVLSGRLLVRAEGHSKQTIGPFVYFYVKPGTPFSVRCGRRDPCIYFAFDAKEELGADRELQQLAAAGETNEVGSTTANASGPGDAGFLVVDLKAGEWRPVPGARGVRRPHGRQAALRARLNTVFPYELRRGATVPRAPDRSDTASFVLSGTLVFRVASDSGRRLGPGSFYRIAGDVEYSASCAHERCIILSTDPPPEWEGDPGLVLFPP